MKRKRLIAVVAMLMLLQAVFLAGCGESKPEKEISVQDKQEKSAEEQKQTVEEQKRPAEEQKQPEKNDTQETDGMFEINESKDGILVGDLLDCSAMLGQTAEELGIPTEVLAESPTGYKTYLDGTICDTTDYGVLHFGYPEEKDGEPCSARVVSIWIHVKEVSFDTIADALSAKFGAAIGEGEEPYAEVNGGSVIWKNYESDLCIVRLSGASERPYLEINISPQN